VTEHSRNKKWLQERGHGQDIRKVSLTLFVEHALHEQIQCMVSDTLCQMHSDVLMHTGPTLILNDHYHYCLVPVLIDTGYVNNTSLSIISLKIPMPGSRYEYRSAVNIARSGSPDFHRPRLPRSRELSGSLTREHQSNSIAFLPYYCRNRKGSLRDFFCFLLYFVGALRYCVPINS